MKATDKQSGIAIRFVQQFDIAKDQAVNREDLFSSPLDAALFLAMRDGRDVPTAEKIADALEYVRLQSPDQLTTAARWCRWTVKP